MISPAGSMLKALSTHLQPPAADGVPHRAGAAVAAASEEVLLWWDSVPNTKRAYTHPIVGAAESFAPGRGLPTLVVCGAKPGPVLLVTAGVHGDEYEPIAAIHRAFAELEPAPLAGTVVLVACCNVDGYLAGTREGGVDGLNLARVFPGACYHFYLDHFR